VTQQIEMNNSNWFTTDYDYSGYAEAVFDEPHAEFYGPASVRPDENGCPIVEITVEQSNPAVQTQFDLLVIEFGSRAVPGGGTVTTIGGGGQNSVGTTVRGENGVFKSGPDWNYRLSWPSDGPLTLRIKPIKSEFAVAASEPEVFLVLPLSTFVTEFPTESSVIGNHPLNLDARSDSHRRGCIPFEFYGQKAFIQQLPSADVSSGVKTLGGEIILTAVAVLPIMDAAMIDPWGWFLTIFLRLLELATGSEVGVPWIEMRDQNGRLARRLHIAVGHLHHLTDGYGAIPKAFHWSGGEYLTVALSSPQAREPFFSIALRHCIRAGLSGLSLDDQLDHLVRALECLCARYGFSEQDLTDGFDFNLKTTIEAVLADARAEIRKLARAVVELGHRTRILRIADRAQSAAQKDLSFGLAVEGLVRHFGLLDSEVLEPYYARHSGLKGSNWVGALSYYRGAVFHEGFLDIDSPGTPVGEVLGFILHLHDLLVRVLLKIVGYCGTYQPRLIRGTAAESADWFKPGIHVDGLLKVPTLGIK
jgi:hypothetical protein